MPSVCLLLFSEPPGEPQILDVSLELGRTTSGGSGSSHSIAHMIPIDFVYSYHAAVESSFRSDVLFMIHSTLGIVLWRFYCYI